jgi:hypothetical protein
MRLGKTIGHRPSDCSRDRAAGKSEQDSLEDRRSYLLPSRARCNRNRGRFFQWLIPLSAVPPGSFNVCTGFSRDIADSSGIQCWMSLLRKLK